MWRHNPRGVPSWLAFTSLLIEGKTPEIGVEHARKLVRSIDTSHVVGLRDRAIIGVLIYTAAGVGPNG
jgi:hypothetical protein